MYWFVCIIAILRRGVVRKCDLEREGWMRVSERGRDEEAEIVLRLILHSRRERESSRSLFFVAASSALLAAVSASLY